MTTYEITITPLGRGRYSASLGDRVLVQSDREPFLSAARVLRAEGLGPDAVLLMRHAGSDSIALRGRLGILAGLTVREDERRGPTFEPYRNRLDRLSSCRRTAVDGDLQLGGVFTPA